MSAALRRAGATTAHGAGCARNCAARSSGRIVAESPMRCTRRPQRSSSRASESIRCAPRLEPIRACSSSTITAWTVRSMARLRGAVSSR